MIHLWALGILDDSESSIGVGDLARHPQGLGGQGGDIHRGRRGSG